MRDINDIIYESLSDHFKKHWKKYALGLGVTTLAGGGIAAYKHFNKPKMSLGKKLAIGTGIAAGTIGTGYLAHKFRNKNKIGEKLISSTNLSKSTPSKSNSNSETNPYSNMTDDELKHILKTHRLLNDIDGSCGHNATDFRLIRNNPKVNENFRKLLSHHGLHHELKIHDLITKYENSGKSLTYDGIPPELKKHDSTFNEFNFAAKLDNAITDKLKYKSESPIAHLMHMHEFAGLPFKYSDSDPEFIKRLVDNEDKIIEAHKRNK